MDGVAAIRAAVCGVILCAASLAADGGNEVNSLGSGTEIDDGPTLPPAQFFLDKIFNKYGDEGIMTFEGFEHLMDSLGLGGGLFQDPHELSLHRINGTFSQIHDPSHRHKRHADHGPKSKLWQCMSPYDILEVYGFENKSGIIKIEPNTFMNLCPALVYQLDQKSCFHSEPRGIEMQDKYLGWIYASLTVFIISATGLLGVAVMPLMHSIIFSQILHFLVALAIGTLCGDALMHLLPHALIVKGTSADDHATPVLKCSLTLLTILLFYSMETIMRIATGKSSHSHSHSMKNITINHDVEDFELNAMMPKPQKKVKKPMTPVALMVILGDGLHNLTDGLAIGAAFSTDPVTGFATGLAVFCHELPHELGDFAVLIKSGMSIKKALCYNVLSSILSFAGTAIGLWLAEDHASASQWIYAATAGTFLYIALADLIPEISGKEDGSMVDFFLSFLGIVLGGILMLSIALYEHKLVYLFETHL